MKILQTIEVPTGHILIVQGELGKLEMLSIGDYGKDVNLKCDAMGLTREIEPVQHQKMMPLEKKWVITVSTQYGCSMGCTYCDVPKVGRGQNATTADLMGQISTGLDLHPEVKGTERLNIHFARMGEPTWNPAVLDVVRVLEYSLPLEYQMHPVVSTMMPRRNTWLEAFIHGWMDIKNNLLDGEAGLQLSINSTDEEERHALFAGNACTLQQIHDIMGGVEPRGRKITLNFPVCEWEIDPCVLLDYFSPEHYIVKLTPMHKTTTAIEHGIETAGDYTEYWPYKEAEDNLKHAGYDVLVFIASREEDEGRITCGNALLSGTVPFGAGVKP
jgi:23S rRNA (adenine2503-C2)-methyltransferase